MVRGKAVIYIGLAFYLPKVERKDLTIYAAKNIALANRTDVEHGNKWASRILGNTYEDVYFQGVKSSNRTAELGMASRLGAKYSENNMGFGEGRVIHTIRLLETCPSKSLIVLEEPETSLHEFAQYEFSKYLMDVSARRGHQIIFSSHSSAMIRALPPEGRKMLSRDENGVKVFDRLSSVHLRNALTEGHDGHLIICVEDQFASAFLRELIKRHNRDLLKRVLILPFGDAKAVKGAVTILKSSRIKAIAVRDADQASIPADSLYTLPGNEPPEKTVFLSDAGKKELTSEYGFNLDHHLTANPDTDHHHYAKIAAAKTGCQIEVLEADCIRAFLDSQDSKLGANLVQAIQESA